MHLVETVSPALNSGLFLSKQYNTNTSDPGQHKQQLLVSHAIMRGKKKAVLSAHSVAKQPCSVSEVYSICFQLRYFQFTMCLLRRNPIINQGLCAEISSPCEGHAVTG